MLSRRSDMVAFHHPSAKANFAKTVETACEKAIGRDATSRKTAGLGALQECPPRRAYG